MLTQEMLIKQHLRHAVTVTRKQLRMECHHCNFLKDHRVMNGIKTVRAPRERPMVLDQHGRDIVRIQPILLKAFNGNYTCIVLVGPIDLFRRHGARTGNLTVEVVTLRRAIGTDALSSLREDRSPTGMRMHNAADIRELLIKYAMRLGIR